MIALEFQAPTGWGSSTVCSEYGLTMHSRFCHQQVGVVVPTPVDFIVGVLDDQVAVDLHIIYQAQATSKL